MTLPQQEPDLSAQKTSDSGNLHGTPLGYLTGRDGFDDFPRVETPVSQDNICIIRLRSVDAAKRAALQKSAISYHDMRAIDEHGISRPLTAFLEKVRAANGLLHVSLDVDFIDAMFAPAVGTTVPGGATLREAHLAMEIICDSELLSALDLVELNPFLDDRGATAQVMTDLAASALGRRVFDRPTLHRLRTVSMQPSEKALVPFVSVHHMMQLIHHIGLERMLCELTDAIEADFLRWPAFDKTPRLASHSEMGVIELMPTSDGEVYGFKYVNGHPSNTRTINGNSLWPARRCCGRLSRLTLGNDAADRPAHGRHISHGSPCARTQKRARHGDDRQWRTVRFSKPRYESGLRRRHCAPLRHRPKCERQVRGQTVNFRLECDRLCNTGTSD